MYLSELIGRLNYLLQSEGDMKVGRMKSMKIDGMITTDPNDSVVNLTSDNFFVLKVYKEGNTNKSLLISF